MSNLVAGVLPLALGAAVSPTVLAVNLVILGSPAKGRSRGAWFALGGFAVIAALTVVAFAGLLPSAASTGGPDTTAAVLDLGCALLLVALGVRALVRTPSDKPSRGPADGPWFAYLGVGAAVMATNFTTIVLYVPAVKDVAHASVPGTTQAAALAVVMVITTVTLWVPLLLTVLAPGTAGRVLGGLNRFLTEHQRWVSVVICFGFAIVLGRKGFSQL